MKNLTITYGDITVFDGEVGQFTWDESEDAVTVTGRRSKARTAGGGGLLDLLAKASRQKTETMRADLVADADDAATVIEDDDEDAAHG